MKLKDSIKLKWVRGNDVALKVTVCEPQYNEAGEPVKDASGNIVWKAVDLDSYDDITVTIRVMPGSEGTSSCNCNCKDKENPSSYIVSSSKSSEEGILIVDIPGTLPNGDYAMEFTGHKNGRAVRALEGMMFGIVECSGKANVTFDVQEGVRSCDLDLKIQMVPSSLVRGKNAYELWKEIPGNEGKTLQDYLDSIGTDAIKALQSDWNETDPNSSAYIRNKPTSIGMEVDSELSSTSVRPVQNKVVQAGLIGILQSVRDSYYPKNRLYTKEEINTLIDSSSKIRTTIVDVLPEASASTMGRIYVVPSQSPTEGNVKTEYITIESDGTYSWEQLGGEGGGSIDPDRYPTIEQMQAAIADAISDSIEDVTYHGEDVGSAASAGFNPQSDTVWTTPQILSETQKTIARNNIDVPSVNMVNSAMADKQDKLVSGITLKTVGGVSLLGEGNIPLPSGGSDSGSVISTLDDVPDGTVRKLSDYATKVQVILKADNDKVVHTTGNEIVAGIKEFDDQINLNDDLQHGSATDYSWIKNASDDTLQDKLDAKQDVLVSGQNIKKINGYDITGPGNLIIPTGSGGNTAVDNEDIEVNAEAKLALKNRNTDYSSKGYVRVRKNLISAQILKRDYENIVWVHGVENVKRTTSAANFIYENKDGEKEPGVNWKDGYKYDEQFYIGNPADWLVKEASGGEKAIYGQYGHDKGFPMATYTDKNRLYQSVIKACPKVILNIYNTRPASNSNEIFYGNRVFYCWNYSYNNNGNIWAAGKIYYDGWKENPYPNDYYAVVDGIPKTFAYVENGIVHYVHWNGSSWERDTKEQKTINSIPDGTFGTENTVYDIMYDIDLNGTTITPAEGVVLRYSGGKIKNGTINMVNGNITIDCPDVEFFENVLIFNADSQILKDIWFDDIWKSVSGRLSNSSPCTAISLSKDHIIDFKDASFSFRYVRKDSTATDNKLTIWGNGHTINVDTDYIYNGLDMFICRYIELHDLSILVNNEDMGVYNTIFNAKNALLYNVKYKGYSRFISNWGASNHADSALILHNCEIRVVSFAFEDPFNIVRFYNSKIAFINPLKRQFSELISIRCNLEHTTVDKCNVEAYDSYIGGVWELGHSHLAGSSDVVDGEYRNYNYMKFHNCELVRFTFDSTTEEKPGNTNIIIEDCHIKMCALPWAISAISSIIYTNCYIDLFDQQQGNTTSAFNFRNIDKAEFRGCTFRKTAFIDPDVTVYGGEDCPEGHTFDPYSETKDVICIIPPKNIVVNRGDWGEGTGKNKNSWFINTWTTSTWGFKLRLIGNRFIAYCKKIDGTTQFSTYKFRCVNPYYYNGYVDLYSLQGRNHVICYGNSFVHSVESPTTYGCHAYLNRVPYVLPFNGTIFTQGPSSGTPKSTYLNYSNAIFDYCDTNFDFHHVTDDGDRRGYYNFTKGCITFLATVEEDLPNGE